MDRFRPLLQVHDITEQQWRVLRVLHETGPVDATLLAKQAAVLGPSLTRMLRALGSRGFIAQSRDQSDRRRSLISLTAKGAAFLDMVAPQSAAIYDAIEDAVGTEAIERLLDGIDDLLDALDQAEPKQDQ